MYEALRNRMLAILRVPPEPHAPMGDPASLRVFRAGRNYLRLRLGVWGAAQFIAFAALVFWTVMLFHVEATAREQRGTRAAQPAAVVAPTEPAPAPATEGQPATAQPSPARPKNFPERFAETMKTVAEASERRAKSGTGRVNSWIEGYKQAMVEVALLLPDWAFPLIWGLKIFSVVVYLVQLPITYMVRRLDYEMRWYMVTDRSLRLRHGVWKVSESTMSFANIQQVDVSQGPLQRVLGLSDVKVKSAGGGTVTPGHETDDMHTGLFHSVTHGSEIRDLVLERLRRFREAGLGDPDDKSELAPASPTIAPADTSALSAAKELLAEAKALRATLS